MRIPLISRPTPGLLTLPDHEAGGQCLRRLSTILILLVFLAGGKLWGQGEAAKVAHVETVDEVLAAAKSGKRLILHQDPQLSAAQVNRLSIFLAQYPNWHMVISGDATSARYTDLAGDSWIGLDALEHGVGKELLGNGPLSEIKHPESGKSHGAAVLLSLKPKGMHLGLGDHYGEMGIDQDDDELFIGAVNYLRSGLRVSDALESLVTTVEGKALRIEEQRIRDKRAREQARLRYEEKLRKEERARARRPYVFGGAGFLTLLTAGGLLAARRKRYQSRAQALVDRYRTAFQDHQGDVVEMRKWGAILASNPTYKGRTKELSIQASTDVRELLRYRDAARRAISEAEASVETGGIKNLFGVGRIEEAEALLSSAPIEVPAKPADADEEELQTLWRGVEAPPPTTMTFQELLGRMDLHGKAADAAIQKVKKSGRLAGKTASLAEARVEGLLHSLSEYRLLTDDSPLLQLPSLEGALLPSVRESLQTARDQVETDPVNSLAIAHSQEGRIQAAEEAMGQFIESMGTYRDALHQGVDQLGAVDIKVGWVHERLREIAKAADDFFSACSRSEATLAPPTAMSLDTLAADVERCLLIDLERRTEAEPSLLRVTDEVVRGRKEIAQTMSLPESAILHEPEADPEKRLSDSREALERVCANLESGDLNAADTTLDEVHVWLKEVQRIVDESRAVLSNHEPWVAEHQSWRNRLAKENLPRHGDLLAKVLNSYDRDVLARGATSRDTSTDENLADNLEEAETAVRTSEELDQRASERYRAGALLEARHGLERSRACLEMADLKLHELAFRAELLGTVEHENRALVGRLEKRAAEIQELKSEFFVTEPTNFAAEEVLGHLDALKQEVGATPGNPFFVEEGLKSVASSLSEVRSDIEADREALAEADRSIAMADELIEQATTLANSNLGAEVGSSPVIRKLKSRVEGAEQRLDRARNIVSKANSDWREADRLADEIHAEIFDVLAALREEVSRGREAASAVAQASLRVRSGESYRGNMFSSRLPGRPGWPQLHQAKQCLARGDYVGAMRHAQQAVTEVDAAIQLVENAERRRQAQRQRRQVIMVPDITDIFRHVGGRMGGPPFGSGPIVRPPRPSSRPRSSGGWSSGGGISRPSGGSIIRRSGSRSGGRSSSGMSRRRTW